VNTRLDLTIGYTYYSLSRGYRSRLAAWKKIKNSYTDINCDRIVIDDASPVPIEGSSGWPALGWDAYRVNEDVGFNNEGARNLIVQLANTQWVMLLDLDHCLNPVSIDLLKQGFLDTLDVNTMYFLNKSYPVTEEWKGNTHGFQFNHNNILISKQLFMNHGGYKIYVPGYYGLDGTLLKNSNIKKSMLFEMEMEYIYYRNEEGYRNNVNRDMPEDIFESPPELKYTPKFTEFMTWRKI
jgi:hypothetical protein